MRRLTLGEYGYKEPPFPEIKKPSPVFRTSADTCICLCAALDMCEDPEGIGGGENIKDLHDDVRLTGLHIALYIKPFEAIGIIDFTGPIHVIIYRLPVIKLAFAGRLPSKHFGRHQLIHRGSL